MINVISMMTMINVISMITMINVISMITMINDGDRRHGQPTPSLRAIASQSVTYRALNKGIATLYLFVPHKYASQ